MNCPVIWCLLLSTSMTLQSIEAFSTFEWTSDGGQWHKASTGLNVNPYTASRSVCIDVPSNLSLCHGIGYNKMRLPNLLQHETLQEVLEQSSSWVPLARLSCHPDTGLFLCSLFAPVCLDHPIPPCRSLCSTVQSACERQMASYGYPWPELVRCDQFPLDNDMCIMAQHTLGGVDGDVRVKVTSDVTPITGPNESMSPLQPPQAKAPTSTSQNSPSHQVDSSFPSSQLSSSSSSSSATTTTSTSSHSAFVPHHSSTGSSGGQESSPVNGKNGHTGQRSKHHHMQTLAEAQEELHQMVHSQSEQNNHQQGRQSSVGGGGGGNSASASESASTMDPLLTTYCRSQWSLRTKASFRGYSSDLIHGRLRSYKIIHGAGTFKGRQHAQIWADSNSTILLPNQLTWRHLLHHSNSNSNMRFFIMGYTTEGRNKATLITEWPVSPDHSFRRSLRIIKSGSIDCTGESATSGSYFHGNSDA